LTLPAAVISNGTKGSRVMQTEFDSDTVVERGKAAWVRRVQNMIANNDFDNLLELLASSRNEPDFADMLRRALVSMYGRGKESGIAEVAKGLLALCADEPPQ
jgi:hypothetical protein